MTADSHSPPELFLGLAPPPPRLTHLQAPSWHPPHPSSYPPHPLTQHAHLEPVNHRGHAFDITESPCCYLVITDAPGLEPSEIHVRVDPANHEHLIIQGEPQECFLIIATLETLLQTSP